MNEIVYVAEFESGMVLEGYTNWKRGICEINKNISGIVVKFPIKDGDSPAKLITYIVEEDRIFRNKKDAMEYLKRVGG